MRPVLNRYIETGGLMTTATSGINPPRRSRRAAALLGVLGLVLMSGGLSLVVQGSASAAPAKVHKSYVCKYVNVPGVGEVLKGGVNPIWVANSSLQGLPASGLAFVGETFSDAQGRSVVVIANTPRITPAPSASICAPPVTTSVTPGVVFSDSVCQDFAATHASWMGANTADIDYAVTAGSVSDGSAVTITATPKTGFSFPPGTTTTFQHTFAATATNCGSTLGNHVTAAAALFQNPACPSNAVAANLGGSGFLSPAQLNAKGNFIDLNHVTYTITGNFAPGGTVNVAASADTGFVLTTGSASHWAHTFTAAVNCHKTVPGHTTIPAVIDSGFTSVGTTVMGSNTALMTWGYGIAGAGAALFLTALVTGRRRRSMS